MSYTLIWNWQDKAIGAECNFCAIEVGEAAGSDAELPALLHANVPQGAHLYIVQRDAKVSMQEIEEVREILDRLEIPVASNELLNADDVRTWVFPVLDDVASSKPVGLAGDDVAAVKQQLAKNEARLLELSKEKEQLQAVIRVMREAGIGQREKKEALTTITNAFNELQFSKHWQGVAGTPGANAVYRMVGEIYHLDQQTQRRVEGLLHTLLLGMRDDPDTLQSVLKVAGKLTAGMTSFFGLSKMCVAYMEHRVASGALDDQPLVALDYARCVQRYRLLEDAYVNKLEAMRDSREHSALLEVDLSMAFEEALIAVLRDGGKRGLSPQKDLTPGEARAADIVQAAWQEMLERGNKGFQAFLIDWDPWRGMASRRLRAQRTAELSQQAMN